ncbi:DUF952 domain-containing protein [Propioniciclava coleopterorum]|uniref:DUF952 domain-containing protein n=1 Tax=Propioniciclava coleopterorum TaxID=2714937 RepID=A0A6G7Y9N0_9ACTN|nr:DUF952 domain-containing protein [Propioniciclava coleopterorum]QIK73386.1 DUF952 domain-containing protein [Propioniciclava coleopterorum]
MAESLPLWHVSERSLWEEALGAGVYRWSTRGRTLGDEGFIHFCYPSQLEWVARHFYDGVTEPLVILEVNRDALGAPIRLESVLGSEERFPHLYGPLPTRAVAFVRTLEITAEAITIGDPEHVDRTGG